MADSESIGKDVFSIALRGYAREEVDEFMKNVSQREKQLRAEVDAAFDERDKLRKEMDGLHTIVNAAKASNQKVEVRATELKNEVDRLLREMEILKRERDSFQMLAEQLAARMGGHTVAEPATAAEGGVDREALRRSVEGLRESGAEARSLLVSMLEELDRLSRLAD